MNFTGKKVINIHKVYNVKAEMQIIIQRLETVQHFND